MRPDRYSTEPSFEQPISKEALAKELNASRKNVNEVLIVLNTKLKKVGERSLILEGGQFAILAYKLSRVYAHLAQRPLRIEVQGLNRWLELQKQGLVVGAEGNFDQKGYEKTQEALARLISNPEFKELNQVIEEVKSARTLVERSLELSKRIKNFHKEQRKIKQQTFLAEEQRRIEKQRVQKATGAWSKVFDAEINRLGADSVSKRRANLSELEGERTGDDEEDLRIRMKGKRESINIDKDNNDS